ncbi:2-C-methyl-D-erythritol 4-phosphate cytidylyltransferase [Halanaerobium saccharolyticum]|uniref:2-C-methyl-D-erythritol 4-phosphate cytidylyltransferase n=1 Tax=Halanaerobium saccharolyticum TaxID=43595 RepID=A0A4R7Z3J3_9FIRM|nr:2-C-methyl-D-erythritol 4-phosphate cytidylyltransferase [Halanaerobium saccharolyticum]RAK07694.1 2-C-methyl-D-erythritol 4-phosphate cytidylyltransferase [Halanaerobium saccharolyticum]TDW03696.1 2-C-methyl-D-erythritol 4-phosphate cytidylyltransferase [Halanaerobium saccharolyticum]TDX59535.1 2-C-methyl-D-erythritol 4-phosphate cytidylyltransferase [Halanaerobium saccharolyticum]
MSEIGVLIAAAGKGRRMGKNINKQFLNLMGKPVLYHTIKTFLDWPRDFELNIVLHPDEIEYFKDNVMPLFLASQPEFNLIAGGKSRKESVNNGLKNFSDKVNYVIIHDGARPMLKKELIERTYLAVKKYDAVSCGIKVKDTIKVVENSFSKKTLARNSLRAIQTPQAFRLDLIKKAHKNYKKDKALDDASLVEELGKKVYIVNGDYNNFKITTPEDLKPAEIILKEQSNV